MKRLVFDSKNNSFKWSDWLPKYTEDYGASCVKKQKYVSDTVRINNNEVSTGSTRTALYTMPGGIDNGVRYSALYETSGLDITEIEANKRIIESARDKVEDMLKEDVSKQIEVLSNAKTSKSSKASDSSETSE